MPRSSPRLLALGLPSRLVALILLAACGNKSGGEQAPSASASSGAPASSTPSVGTSPTASSSAAPGASASASAPPSDALPGKTEGCPEGMVLVEGNYCPDVEQRCLEHHKEYEGDQKKKRKRAEEGGDGEKSTVSERCLRYESPSRCLSKEKRPMRFCVDRYEWPNKKGEKPEFLLSWMDAKKKCEDVGKRLCTVAEFNFACEGEDMLPYTYGYERDAQKCAIDKPYKKRKRKLYKYERCMRTPACKDHLAELDQREPAGNRPECVSPFGAFDMNGNINEWVEIPGKKYPDRSGLKGGWWGPVRGRCRPTVGFHKEEDYGYEEGFRCCANAAGGSASP